MAVDELRSDVYVLLETLDIAQDYIHKVFHGVFSRFKNTLVYIGVAIHMTDILRRVFIRGGKSRLACILAGQRRSN